jgi:hypothetical protein
MKVTFVKKEARRYAVTVSRNRHPDLWCRTIGYHEWLPHDLLHFVAASSETSPQAATRGSFSRSSRI